MTDDEVRARTGRLMASYQELLLARRFEEWIELWAEDAVCEFPYATDPGRQRYQGREQILDYMAAYPSLLSVDEVVEMTVHPGHDPSVLVIELAIRGTATVTGRPYDQRYVVVARADDDGRLAHYREYWNPLILAAAVGS